MGRPITETMSRIINVKTSEVISALKKNKEIHITEYKKARKAYKLEGLEQLEQIKKDLEEGKTGLGLILVEPIDRAEVFDDNILMFEQETKKDIELETEEFKNFYLDKGHTSRNASTSNSMYFAKFGL